MSSELIAPGSIAELQAHIATETREEVIAGIRSSFSVIGQELLSLAFRAKRASELGIDLQDLKIPHIGLLMKIAHGQVDALVVLRFSGSISLLNQLSNLPLPDQKRIAKGDKIPFVVIKGDAYDVRMKDPLDLSYLQMSQVFDRQGGIRDEAGQIAFLERAAAKQGPSRIPIPKLSFSRRELAAIRKAAGHEDLTAWLRKVALLEAGYIKN